jgi:hypothetical protein
MVRPRTWILLQRYAGYGGAPEFRAKSGVLSLSISEFPVTT